MCGPRGRGQVLMCGPGILLIMLTVAELLLSLFSQVFRTRF